MAAPVPFGGVWTRLRWILQYCTYSKHKRPSVNKNSRDSHESYVTELVLFFAKVGRVVLFNFIVVVVVGAAHP